MRTATNPLTERVRSMIVLGQSPGDCKMLKQVFLGASALSIIGLSNIASAQYDCAATPVLQSTRSATNLPVMGQGQSYQRYSYAPTDAPQSSIAAQPQASMTASQTYQPSRVTVAPQSQSYRRYSYQPGARSNNSKSSRKPAYTYSKTDPRRYSN